MNKPDALPDELDLILSDLNGIPRGKTIASKTLTDSEAPHLAEAIFFQTIMGGYSTALEKFDANDGDLLMLPDWSTYCQTPWKPGNVGQVICETKDQRGNPIAYDPRNVLKKVLQEYEDIGLVPIVAPEVELYLLDPVTRDDRSLQAAAGKYGQSEFGGEAFSLDALDKFSPVLEEVKAMSRDCGLELSAIVHEMGPAQVELNVHHGEAMSRADQFFLLKRLIKGCAHKHGLLASFMAKPLLGFPGSGQHLHCSLLGKNGNNQFKLRRRKAPPVLRHFIGGLQKYLPQAFALIAPNVNSYKRFVRGLSAPINLEWGYDNRTTGLRVPFSDPEAGRVENRVAGADANPYLMIASTSACGLLGLRQELEPSQPISDDAYNLKSTFPRDLNAALNVLEQSDDLADLLSRDFVEVFVSVKRTELRDFMRTMTQWEVSYLGSAL